MKLLAGAGLILAAAATAPAQLKVSLGTRFDLVGTDYQQAVKSSELILPMKLQYSFSKETEVSARVGWVSARYQNAFGSLDRKVSGLTDLAFQARHGFALGALRPFVTARVNGPTGEPSWAAFRTQADLPSEYLAGDVWGRGLTYGGSVGLSAPGNLFTPEISAGFVKNKGTHPVEDDPDTELVTGAVGLVRASLEKKGSLGLKVHAAYAGTGATQVQDQSVFRQRNIWTLGLDLGGSLSESLRLDLLTSETFFSRAFSATQAGFEEEAAPRLGSRFDVRLQGRWKGNSLGLEAELGARHVVSNALDSSSSLYDAGGNLVQARLGARKKSKVGVLGLSLSQTWVHDKEEGSDEDGNLIAVDWTRLSVEGSVTRGF